MGPVESKIEVDIKTGSTIQYPILMKAKDWDFVVLFHKKECGMVVYSKNPPNNPVGLYSEMWDMSQFSPFNGKVTLENKE